MVNKIFGSFLGKKASNYSSASKSGNFFTNEQMILQKNNEWSVVPGSTEATAFSSVDSADSSAAQGIIGEGTHYFKFSNTHAVAQYYYKPSAWNNGSTDKGAIRVFVAVSESTPSENYTGNNIPMDYIVVGRRTGSTTAYFNQSAEVEFSSQQLFNTTSGVSGTSRNYWNNGGTNYNGTKVMLGGGGKHEIYESTQNPCSWGSANGSVGAGFDNSCGSYPNGLKLGLGDSDAYYNNISGTFEFWVWNQ